MKHKITTLAPAIGRLVKFILLTLSLPVIGPFVYKRNSETIFNFCRVMTGYCEIRSLYGLIFANMMATANLAYLWFSADNSCMAVVIVLSLCMASNRLMETLLHTIKRSQRLLFILMIVTLAFALSPGLYIIAVNLYLIMVATIFFPSRSIKIIGGSSTASPKGQQEIIDAYFND